MGAAQTKNVANVTTKAISTVATNIVQDTKLTSDQTQIISVDGGRGDVNISGNHFNQQVTLNMSALLKAMVTQKAQQDLSLQVQQAAKSLCSGLNLGQFTDATNIMNTYVEAAIDITSQVSQTCAAAAKQNQSITVNNRDGNITITDNTFQQVSNIFSKCVEDAVSDNSAMQKIQEKLDQSAEATSKGISVWALAILAIVVLLIMGAPFVFATSSAVQILSKLLFPLLMFAGIILLAYYFGKKKTSMDGYAFSPLLKNNAACGATAQEGGYSQYASASEASNACKADSTCQAVDWQGMTIDSQGDGTVLSQPVTTFYSHVDSSPCPNVTNHPDTLKVLRSPRYRKRFRAVTLAVKRGDIWIDSQDSAGKSGTIRSLGTRLHTFPVNTARSFPVSME